jgi:hypothetical protein
MQNLHTENESQKDPTSGQQKYFVSLAATARFFAACA